MCEDLTTRLRDRETRLMDIEHKLRQLSDKLLEREETLRGTEGKLKQTKDKLKLAEDARVAAEREIKGFHHTSRDVLAGKGEINLIVASTYGRLGEVRMLLELGVDVNCKDKTFTLLHLHFVDIWMDEPLLCGLL
eukprot:GHVR01078249.1.p1 GENE.GHVR01078249.1~~GHVR01078249.1.p1  ORF type:complete len:135 (+),score=23.37 GHVR01078249.1:296-700(+)